MNKLTFSNGAVITEKGAANIWTVNKVQKEEFGNQDIWSFVIVWGNEQKDYKDPIAFFSLFITGTESDVKADREKLLKFMDEVEAGHEN